MLSFIRDCIGLFNATYSAIADCPILVFFLYGVVFLIVYALFTFLVRSRKHSSNMR